MTLCVDCGINTLPIPPRNRREAQWYMVTDEVWSSAGMNGMSAGCLCLNCIEHRLKRPLAPEDFALLPINYPLVFDDTPRLEALKQAVVDATGWKENT